MATRISSDRRSSPTSAPKAVSVARMSSSGAPARRSRIASVPPVRATPSTDRKAIGAAAARAGGVAGWRPPRRSARMVDVQIAVLTKQIPNPETTPRLDADGLLVREGGVLDPGDEVGLELALQLVEAGEGEVTAVSMGPPDAAGAIRRAMAMGAHRGIHVADPTLRGADTLVTARVLAAVLRRAPFDLVVAGAESTDGYTGTMPVALADPAGGAERHGGPRAAGGGRDPPLERQTASGYDVGQLPDAGGGHRHRRRHRAAVPQPQGHHAGEAEAARGARRAGLGLDAGDLEPTQRVTGRAGRPGRLRRRGRVRRRRAAQGSRICSPRRG